MADTQSHPAAGIVRAQPLTAPRFAPFGTIAAADGKPGRSVNQGRAHRFEGVADLSHDPAAARTVLDLYRIEPSQFPFAVTCLERHPLSSQVFAPMTCTQYLVIVAKSDRQDRPDLARVSAFVGDGAQLVHYRQGTWHAPMVALGAPCVMTMLMWESGDPRDCEEFFVAAPLRVIA